MRHMNQPDPHIETYTVLDTPFGPMALGARRKRLRGVILPQPGKTHPDDLASRIWPSAKPSRSVLPDLVSQVRAYWKGKLGIFRVALDLEGRSPFFRKVWQAAMRIPPGEVRTYGQLAAMVDAPRSARAVGGAMAANPFPLIVPCHRVVAASGLGGFSAPGGVRLKETLLDWERTCCRRGVELV
jgi:methylated-DNA-[protein]-cysteine S-methyltransferase